MKFIDSYNSVIPKSYKRIGTKNFGTSESDGLKEFAKLIDDNLETNISKQEAGIPFSGLISLKASSKIKRSTSGLKLISIIEEALDIENNIWVSSWITTKTLANALLPPPLGPGFPSYLEYSSPPPSSPAVGGTGTPAPKGSLFLSHFNSKTNKMGDAKYIGKAIQKQLEYFYLKWSKTGPKPYLPIPS